MKQQNIIQEKIIDILRPSQFIDTRDQNFAVRQIRDLITRTEEADRKILKALRVARNFINGFNSWHNSTPEEKKMMGCETVADFIEHWTEGGEIEAIDYALNQYHIQCAPAAPEKEADYTFIKPRREVIHAG